MPIFGENIGRAYVEIVASGDGLDESIRREFHDSEPSVREGGKRHGVAYGEEFDRAVREDFEKRLNKTQGEMFDDLNRALTQSMNRLDFGRQFFDSEEWRNLRQRMGDEGGAAGELFAHRLESQFRDSFDPNVLESRIRDSGPGIRKAQEDILDAMEADAYRMNTDFDRNIRSQQDRLMTMFREYEQELQRMERGESGVHHTRQSLIADFEKLRGLFSSMGIPNMNDDFSDMERRLIKVDSAVDRARLRFQRWGQDIDRFGNSVGRVFGLGSRNNFLNIFGGIIAAGVKLPGLFTSIGEKVSEMAGSFQELREAQGLMGAIGITAAQGVAGIIALAAALVVLSLIIGPLISLLIGLVGILLALASSVVLAAAAVGGVLLGALGPLVLALGVTVLAVTDLVKHAGPLSKSLNALKSDFRGLADTARDAAFARLPQQLDQLHGILKGLDPLVRAVGRGISIMISQLLRAFQSPAFIQFRNTFEKAMPGIMRRLGSITANAFEGLFGLFRALLPLVQRFLGWLDSITGQFARWVNSSRGQNAVQDFFDRAAHSAQELGGFIAACVGLISDLVDSGQGAGDSMFASLTDKINEFRAFLQEPVALKTQPKQFSHMGQSGAGSDLNIAPPQTETRLQAFFKWVQKLADELGKAAVAAGKLMGAFNNKDSQRGLSLFIGALTTALALLTEIQTITGGIFGFFGRLGSLLSSIPIFGGGHVDVGKSFGDIGKNFHDIFAPIGNVFHTLVIQPIKDGWRDISHLFGEIHINWGGIFGHLPSGGGFAKLIHLPTGSEIAKLIGNVNVSGIITGGAKAAGKLLADFAGMPGKLLHRIGPVSVSGIIKGAGTAAGGLLGSFAGMAAKLLGRIGPVNVSGIIKGAPGAAGGLLGAFAGMAAKILGKVSPVNVSGIITGAATAAARLVDAFRGLAGNIVAAIGTVTPHVSIPHISILGHRVTAAGGIFAGAQARIIGEAGPEAVVPLDRPLNQVDPAVRALSAFAQGLRTTGTSSQHTGASKNVHNEITVVTPTTDPHAVAVETVNYLTAVGGY